jgi:hypothetical protein
LRFGFRRRKVGAISHRENKGEQSFAEAFESFDLGNFQVMVNRYKFAVSAVRDAPPLIDESGPFSAPAARDDTSNS